MSAQVTPLASNCEHLKCAASPQQSSYFAAPAAQLLFIAHPTLTGVLFLATMPITAVI
jgi:hypothetical protein